MKSIGIIKVEGRIQPRNLVFSTLTAGRPRYVSLETNTNLSFPPGAYALYLVAGAYAAGAAFLFLKFVAKTGKKRTALTRNAPATFAVDFIG